MTPAQLTCLQRFKLPIGEGAIGCVGGKGVDAYIAETGVTDSQALGCVAALNYAYLCTFDTGTISRSKP